MDSPIPVPWSFVVKNALKIWPRAARQPYAGIADGHQKVFVFRSLRFDRELARPFYILHRIDAIEHQVS